MATKVVCCEFADVPMNAIFHHESSSCIDSGSQFRLYAKIGKDRACRCDRYGGIHPNWNPIPFDADEPVELLDHPADTEFVKYLTSVTEKLDRIRRGAESVINGDRVAGEIDIMIVKHLDKLLDCAVAYVEAK